MPPSYKNLVEVSYDLKGAYVAWPVANTDIGDDDLRRVIDSMIADGELAKASYDIGERGGLAFKLDGIKLSDCDEANDTAVISTILEGALSARLSELAPA